ncbi:MAG TPA: type II secretion system protein, partial [Bdellovibrionales bacterium]|nr:type II secretion system protein [Bdellovibrionales bacterium]
MESLDFKSVARKNSQSGFSLVEALIALAMLSVAATLISQYSTFFVSRDRGYKRACEAYAQSIVNVVQEETYYREVLHFLQTNTAQVPAFLNGPSIAVPNVATHWTGAPAADFNLAVAGTAATGVTLRNYHLINGSIRALTTIYNTTPAVRGVFGIYPPLTANAAVLPVPPLFARLGVNVRMRIQPYLIATQAASAPATPVFIRPTSRTNVNDVSAFAAGSGNLAIPAINNEGPTLLVPVPDRIANPGTAIDILGTGVRVLDR